jgi:hypothetical protein
VEGPLTQAEKSPRRKTAHLMCRSRFLGIVGALGSAYFAYLGYAHLRDADVLWNHDWWSLLAYSVWIVLLLGLLSEVRCRRERFFFGLLLLNLGLGFAFSLWDAAPIRYAREARQGLLVLWLVAAAVSLMTLSRRRGEEP